MSSPPPLRDGHITDSTPATFFGSALQHLQFFNCILVRFYRWILSLLCDGIVHVTYAQVSAYKMHKCFDCNAPLSCSKASVILQQGHLFGCNAASSSLSCSKAICFRPAWIYFFLNITLTTNKQMKQLLSLEREWVHASFRIWGSTASCHSCISIIVVRVG